MKKLSKLCERVRMRYVNTVACLRLFIRDRSRSNTLFRFSMAVHEPKTVPIALNSFALWLALMIGLTIVNYGYPIAKLMALSETSVPAIPVGVK